MEVQGLVVVEDIPGEPRWGGSGWPAASAQIANKPIIHHVLENLAALGIRQAVVASSAKNAGEIRECLDTRDDPERPSLRYVQCRSPLDLAGALHLAAPIIGGMPCVAHLANGLLGEPLHPLLERLRDDVVNVVVTVHSGQVAHRHLSAATQEMLHLAELVPERAALSIAGVYLFGPRALSCVSTTSWRAGGDTDLTSVAKLVTTAGGRLDVLAADAWRAYAGDPLDLLELNRIVLDRLEIERRHASSNDNRIEGRVSIHESASVRASMIVGPAVIGPNAQIVDAYIGPYTSVGAGARIQGAEVERSIIAAGASIMHIGGRLAASVVGRDARIVRDFELPRALRLRVGDGTEVGLC
jgi:glucose-1-phosphate thymidylyltransferase